MTAGNSPVWNVRDYGATGDGVTLDSDAINRTIEAAVKAGGGRVWIPSGVYACFSIRMKSNICLFLDHGATLLAASPTQDEGYDLREENPMCSVHAYQDAGHSYWQDSLIWGIGLENVSIEGMGLIDGKGLNKWDTDKPGDGNKAIALKNCRNVIIRDIRILRGGHFCILPTGVENFTIDNVQIDSNRDGINIDCCRNVRISNCAVNTPNDDAIVLKASMALGVIKDTENVTITNCQVMGYDMGTFFDGTYGTKQIAAPDFGGVTGRIKLGTESTGGFKNITISNCTFEHCRGLALETVDGGDLEDVTVSNITMRDIVNAPIFLRRAARMRGPAGRAVGQFRRVLIENVSVHFADRKYASLLMGIPGAPVEDVTIRGVQLHLEGGAASEKAEVVVPELVDGYPDPRNFGQIPSHGFYIRHARRVRLGEVYIKCIDPDQRPCFYLEDVHGIRVRSVEFDRQADVPAFKLTDCREVDVRDTLSVRDFYESDVSAKTIFVTATHP